MNCLTAILLILLQLGFPWSAWNGAPFTPAAISLPPGFPYFHGNNVPDPVFGNQAPQREFHPSARQLAPHAAALGMRFYTGSTFPPEYQGQIFIAEHGSWNRSEPIGYRITRVRLANGRPASYEVFAGGWLRDDGVIGMPVDLEILDDGSMLVSDDDAGTGGSGVAGADKNTTVHIHRGVIGDTNTGGGISDLNSSIHRWLNPVAEIVIEVLSRRYGRG